MNRFARTSLLNPQKTNAELKTSAVNCLKYSLLTGKQNGFRLGEVTRRNEYYRQALVGFLHRWRNPYCSLEEVTRLAGSSDLL